MLHNISVPSIQVKQSVEASLGRTFSEFTAQEFITQVVAGTNFIMKVRADDEYIHVKLHRPLPFRNAPPALMAVQEGKSASDELRYFE